MNNVFRFMGLRDHDIEDTGVKNKREEPKKPVPSKESDSSGEASKVGDNVSTKMSDEVCC